MRNLVNLLVIMALMIWSCQSACTQPIDAFEASLQKLKAADAGNYQQVLEEIVQQQQNMEFDNAKANLEDVLKVAEKLPYKNAIPDVLQKLGDLHKAHQLYADSYTYYEEALRVAETNHLVYEIAKAKTSLGALMLEQFMFDKGIVYYLEAADLFKQHGYPYEVQEVFLALGGVYYRGKDFTNAIKYYRKVLNTIQNNADLPMKMSVINNLGLSFYKLNKYDSALSYYQKSLEIAYALPDSFFIGLVSGNIGVVYMHEGKLDKASEYLKKDIQLSKQYEEWGSVVSAMTSLATIFQKKGDFEKASQYLDSARLIVNQSEQTVSRLIYLNEAYVKLYEMQQDYKKAFEYLSLIARLKDSLQVQIQTQKAAAIDAAYNFDKNLAEIDYLYKNSKLQRFVIGVFSVSTLILFIFSFVLSKLIRHRTQAHRILAQQKQEIEQHNTALQIQKDKSLQQNKALEKANEQISVLNKKLEQKVRFSEEILRSAYENASEAYFIMQAVKDRKTVKDFVCLDVNQAAEQLLHLSKEELLGERILSILPFVGADGYFNTLTKVFEENTDFERDICLGEGEKFPAWVQMTANQIEGGIAMKIKDITKRKEAEVAFRESEGRLRTVINNIPVILWTTNKDGIFTMSEGKALEKMAVQSGQLVGISIFDLLVDYEDQLKLLRNALNNGIAYESTEKMGNTIFNAKVFPLRNEQQEVIGLIGMSIDITERVAYEEKLKQSEANLNAIINNTNYSIWSVDTELRIIAVNSTFKEAFQLAFEGELKIGEFFPKNIPDLEANIFNEAYAKALKGTNHNFEYSFKGRYYDVLMNPIITDGQITGVAVFSQDITERKKTQEKLIESEERLSLATKTANIGIWDIDLPTSHVIWDETMRDIYGLKNGEVQNLASWDKYLYPDDIDFLKKGILELQRKGKQDVEFRIVRPDGQMRYIKGLAQIYRNQHDQPVRIIGVNLDITDQKENEEKLKQQHQEIIKTNKKIAEYKLMALRSVMNPHFLFNSLSSIQFFIAKNEREQALNYLSLFSKLIRGILNSSVSSTIPLAQELEILKYYVELESLRFENKFETDFVVSDDIDVDNLEIPSLLIQPYVENAIIHGLYNKEGHGKLTVSLSQHKNLLQCVVEDNGVGRKEALHIKKQNSIRHKSVGMLVTKERLDIINTTNKVSVKIHDLRDERGLACGTSVKILIQI